MPRWVRVAAVGDCPPGNGIEVVAGEKVLALFKVDGEFHAVDGICAHQGGPLGKGKVEGDTVTCPWHGWQYDIRTGRHLLSRISQRVFPVKTEGDSVLVDVGEDDASAGENVQPSTID
jgi:nitrite reductase (NADH) small subunit